MSEVMTNIARIARRFTAPQSFDNFIVVAGFKVRPVVEQNGADLRISLEIEVNGQWKEVASRLNP